MSLLKHILFLSGLMVIGFSSVFAQAAGDYRSAATGNWNAVATWEQYSGSAWAAASTVPDSTVGAITIQSGHTVTITADQNLDSLQILGGGHLVVNAGDTVFVGFNGDGMGIDVDTLATATVNGIIKCYGRVSGADSSVVFNDGGVYLHDRNSGSVPRATWETGSTIILRGVTGNSPSNMNQNFYNLVIDCAGMTANLNLGMTGNTVRGNVTCLNTGSQRYYLTASGSYASPITLEGDVIVTGGAFSINGSGSKGTVDPIVVYSYGDVIVTGGNFGCSRGSKPSVSWFLYGDTMSVQNATLQNSANAPDAIQKFIFSKQGTQYLRMTNVGYSTSTSPVTFEVAAGATLDMDTTHIPGPVPPSSIGSTGSFILDSGATLVTNHAGAHEGSIEATADYGGGNNFVNLSGAVGSGAVTVKAYKGPHPNIYDTSKTLHRYWTITADPGITKGNLTFYYYDLDPVGTEVRGTEASYKALRYAGVSKDWFTDVTSTDDDVFDFVSDTGVTTISGVWTVGEAAPAVSVQSDRSILPEEFYVEQNYPNPFNPSTIITFGLPQEEEVVVRVYNLLGQRLATLLEGKQTAGIHTLTFDASRLPSGVYVYTVSAGGVEFAKQMVLLK